MLTCKVQISMQTNKNKIEMNETYAKTIMRALQYVKGDLGITAELTEYAGTNILITIPAMSEEALEDKLTNFQKTLDAAVRALIPITSGAANRFFAPYKHSSVQCSKNDEIIFEKKGLPQTITTLPEVKE